MDLLSMRQQENKTIFLLDLLLSMNAAARRLRANKEYKVILVGDPCVGKTAFVRRFVTNQFDPSYKATLGGMRLAQ